MIKRLLAALLVAALMVLMAAPAMAELAEGVQEDSPELWTCYTSNKGEVTGEDLLRQEAIDLIESGSTTVLCENEDGQELVRTLEGKARMRAR